MHFYFDPTQGYYQYQQTLDTKNYEKIKPFMKNDICQIYLAIYVF